jgi:hypothetical protein
MSRRNAGFFLNFNEPQIPVKVPSASIKQTAADAAIAAVDNQSNKGNSN